MTIDTERLKTDAAYWDEVDDTKGKATHYCTQGGGFCTPDHIRQCDIPRPTKPVAPEWNGDGLPPVGCECEGDADTRPGGYEKCLVVYHDECAGAFEHSTLALFRQKGSQKFTDPEWCSDFRPLRTKEQRQRDDLANEISKAAHRLGFTLDLNESDKLSDAAIKFFEERYNLEPKQ